MAFRFDARAVLAEIQKSGSPPAIAAIAARETAARPETLATITTIATPDLDRFTERAAIAEFDGGLSRADAEAIAAQAQGFENPAALYRAAGR